MNNLNLFINHEELTIKRVFPPPRQTARQGNKRRGAGFFCYFSCPPRKVAKKMADGNYLEIRKADFQTAITSFQENHQVWSRITMGKAPVERILKQALIFYHINTSTKHPPPPPPDFLGSSYGIRHLAIYGETLFPAVSKFPPAYRLPASSTTMASTAV